MVEESFLRPRPHEVAGCDPIEAVQVTRDLLIAEAESLGLLPSSIDVPINIHARDGGVDAEVLGAESESPSGLIHPGRTRYQIKSSTGRSNRQAIVNEILFRDSGELAPRVKDCAQEGGTLVAVLFEDELPDQEETDQLESDIHSRLTSEDPAYEDTKIKVIRQNQLISSIARYPSVARRVREVGEFGFQTHDSWAGDWLMDTEFIENEQQRNRIEDARELLIGRDEAVHLPVTGDPGVGKTRTILEATDYEQLSPLVCYFEGADALTESPLWQALLVPESDLHAILVIDECSPTQASYLWEKLGGRGPRIALITIHHEDPAVGASGTTPLEVPPLQNEIIAEIIESYGIESPNARRWAEFCSGSPRVAHLLGRNLSRHPEDALGTHGAEEFWKRCIAGDLDPADDQVRERHLVLRHLSLFRKFGFSEKEPESRDAILDLLANVSPVLTRVRVEEIVETLRSMRLIQGTHFLYISPKALHIWLWTQWWDIHGDGERFTDLTSDLPEQLEEAAYEMLRYAEESDLASRVVQELLDEGGPFESIETFHEGVGSQVFRYLTEAAPESALRCLERAIGDATKETLLHFRQGRRSVVESLRVIAFERGLFGDAARLLLDLAEAENESWSNNASGVFASLFSLAPDPRVSPTAAPPEDRIQVLREAFSSDSPRRRRLAIDACDTALETSHFVRDIGPERRGLRPERRGWSPDSRDEWAEAYRDIWELLLEQKDQIPPGEATELSQVLARRSRGLVKFPELREMVLSTLEELSEEETADWEALVQAVIQIVRYEHDTLEAEELQGFLRLRERIEGGDFSTQIRRYVGVQIVEDQFDEEGHHSDNLREQWDRLADYAIKNPTEFFDELDWLLSSDAKNAGGFGYHVGDRDVDLNFFHPIAATLAELGDAGSPKLLGGYLRAVYERDEDAWEGCVEDLARDLGLIDFLPHILARSGLNETTGRLLLTYVSEGDLPPTALWIRPLHGLPPDILEEWLGFLVAQNDVTAARIALDLTYQAHSLSRTPEEPAEDVLWSVLTALPFRGGHEESAFDQSDVRKWTELARTLSLEGEETWSLELADWIFAHVGESKSIVNRFYSPVNVLLNDITREHPDEMWSIVRRHLEEPFSSKGYMIGHWLEGTNLDKTDEVSPFHLFPLDSVFSWIEEEELPRATYVARRIPIDSLMGDEETRIARKLLDRFGRHEEVRRALTSNLLSGGGWGPPSERFRELKEVLEALREEESHPTVLRWIDETLPRVEAEIDEMVHLEEQWRSGA